MNEPTDGRTEEVLGHLQTAASELIAAARLALDIADDLVTRSLQALGDATRPGPSAPPAPIEKIEVTGREEAEG